MNRQQKSEQQTVTTAGLPALAMAARSNDKVRRRCPSLQPHVSASELLATSLAQTAPSTPAPTCASAWQMASLTAGSLEWCLLIVIVSFCMLGGAAVL